MALFAEDDVISNLNNRFVGLTEIRDDLQNLVAMGIKIANVSIEVSGNTVTAAQEIRQPQFAAFGIDRIIQIAVFEFRDGLITSLMQTPDTSDPDTASFVEAGGGGGGGGSGPPGALPNTGSGGLADSDRAIAWTALSLAAGLAMFRDANQRRCTDRNSAPPLGQAVPTRRRSRVISLLSQAVHVSPRPRGGRRPLGIGLPRHGTQRHATDSDRAYDPGNRTFMARRVQPGDATARRPRFSGGALRIRPEFWPGASDCKCGHRSH